MNLLNNIVSAALHRRISMKDVKGNCNDVLCCIYVNAIWEFLPDYLYSKVRGTYYNHTQSKTHSL